MELDDLYELNPSEALERLKVFKNKDEYEGLTKEEAEEYKILKGVVQDTVDLKDEDFTY